MCPLSARHSTLQLHQTATKSPSYTSTRRLYKSAKGPALLCIHGGGMSVGNPQLQTKPSARKAEDNSV